MFAALSSFVDFVHKHIITKEFDVFNTPKFTFIAYFCKRLYKLKNEKFAHPGLAGVRASKAWFYRDHVNYVLCESRAPMP
jgi:hypothetical protein